jgi:hypothetical protein
MAAATFNKNFNPLPDFQAAGFRPTSGFRTQAHQNALKAQGLTKTSHSQHTAGNAIDLAVPQGWSKAKAIQWVKQRHPTARVEETNGNSIHVTFPGWGGAPDVSNSRKRYR